MREFKKIVFSISIAILLLILPAYKFMLPDYQPVSENCNGTFRIKSMGNWVDGTIGGIKGDIYFDENKLSECRINIFIDPNKVITGNTLRDDHLKTNEYFSSKKHPIIQYTCSQFTKKRKQYIAHGSLKIKEFSKPCDLTFTITKTDSMMVFHAKGKLMRLDYGVGTKSKTLGNKVYINLDVPCKVRKK